MHSPTLNGIVRALSNGLEIRFSKERIGQTDIVRIETVSDKLDRMPKSVRTSMIIDATNDDSINEEINHHINRLVTEVPPQQEGVY